MPIDETEEDLAPEEDRKNLLQLSSTSSKNVVQQEEDAAPCSISPQCRGTDQNSSDLFPPAFFCPLSLIIFEDPVVVQSGITFERAAAAAEFGWKEDNSYSNRALKSIIDETRAITGNSVGGNLRRLQRTLSNTLGEIIDSAMPNNTVL